MKKKKQIYIAGPLFSEHERKYLEEIVENLATRLGLNPRRDIFLPHRDAGDIGVHGKGRDEVFSTDVKFLDGANIVIALLDGPDVDSGTAVELGYAFARNKKIFGILTDWRRWNPVTQEFQNINNMIWGVCDKGRRMYRKIDDKFIEDLRRCMNERS
jgi:nucleoside 2-deoxyribosyltransferase